MGTLNRRTFLRVTALAAAASTAACAPATPPAVAPVSSDTARAVPIQAAASPPPTQSVTSPVAPTPAAPSPQPTQVAAWQKEWEEVISAARAEGKLSLLTWGARVGYRRVIERFRQAFPGIVVDWLAESSASVWLGKVRQERRAGIYSFDLALVQPDAALTHGQPEGTWAPIRPLLFRPDVLDDGAWRGGLSARFLDVGGTLCFAWEYLVIHAYAINTDLVQDGEIRTVEDLVDRKWRGKIISSDPRIGLGLVSAASVAKNWGTDVVKQLLVDQRPTFSVGGRHLTEALVRGRHPIALGVRPKALSEFRDQGLGDKVKFLDLPDADFAATTSLMYFDRAPHPAAARLFANWILTREGQTVLTSNLPTNSARTDVAAFERDGIGTAGKAYYEPDREANYQHTADIQKFIHGLPGTISLTA